MERRKQPLKVKEKVKGTGRSFVGSKVWIGQRVRNG